MPALAALMERVAAGTVRVVEATVSEPSPFAHPLLFGYTAALLYQEDLPHAERRAHLLSLDPDAIAALLGDDGAADLLDEAVLAQVEAELQRLASGRWVRPDAEGVADLLRELGPLTLDELAARCRGEEEGGHGNNAVVRAALDELECARRALPVRIGTRPCWARTEDAPMLHAALGVDVPDWAEGRGGAVQRVGGRGPLGELVLRHVRTRAAATTQGVADAFGLGTAVVAEALAGLESEGALVRLGGAGGAGGAPRERWMAPDVLRRVRSRSLARARQAVRPVPGDTLQRLVLERAGLVCAGADRAEDRDPLDALADALAVLEGVPLPAAAWERHVLPARVPGYRPSMLDELLAAGDVLWRVVPEEVGATPGSANGAGADDGAGGEAMDRGAGVASGGAPARRTADRGASGSGASARGASGRGAVPVGLIAFYPSDSPLAPVVGAVLADEDVGSAGTEPVSAGSAGTLPAAVLRGLATAPTFAPVRAALRADAAPVRPRRVSSRRGRGRLAGLARPASSLGTAASGASGVGRVGAVGPPRTAWFRLDPSGADDEEQALAEVESLLERYGVLSRDIGLAAGLPGGLTPLTPVLRRMEDVGTLLRGVFVEGLGPAQLATADVVDRLRALAAPDALRSTFSNEVDGDTADLVRKSRSQRAGAEADAVVLEVKDPACLAGSLLPWPEPALPPGLVDGASGEFERPVRRAGASVVLIEGRPVLHAVENWRTLTSFTVDVGELERALVALADAERAAAAREAAGRTPRRIVERLNGVPALDAGVSGLLGRAGLVLDPRGMRLHLDPYGRG